MPAIPWQLILKQAPALLSAAGGLVSVSRVQPPEIAAGRDIQTLRDQVAALATEQQASTALLRQLTDHVALLTKGAEATAARVRLTLILAGLACALGLAAGALAMFR